MPYTPSIWLQYLLLIGLQVLLLLYFCREILKRHYFIRSAAIADHVGHLMATACRHRLIPLMTQEESSRAAAQAAIRAATRNKFKSKIGELQFSLSRYEKLVRATVPIKNGEKAKFLLLLTFDSEAEADSIILKRILPYVVENKDYFVQGNPTGYFI